MIDRSTKVTSNTHGRSFLVKHWQHQELLSEMVQSQWGPVRLFDLCLRCDHLGMALALAAHGVPGCILEDHHVGPISADYSERRCSCQGWNTCHYCCWAFPVEQGIFMQDWDEALVYAIPAAREAAATPSPMPCWTFAALTWSFPSAGLRRRWHGFWTLPCWRATRKLPSTCPRSASYSPSGDG